MKSPQKCPHFRFVQFFLKSIKKINTKVLKNPFSPYFSFKKFVKRRKGQRRFLINKLYFSESGEWKAFFCLKIHCLIGSFVKLIKFFFQLFSPQSFLFILFLCPVFYVSNFRTWLCEVGLWRLRVIREIMATGRNINLKFALQILNKLEQWTKSCYKNWYFFPNLQISFCPIDCLNSNIFAIEMYEKSLSTINGFSATISKSIKHIVLIHII